MRRPFLLVALVLIACVTSGCFTTYRTKGAPVPYGDSSRSVLHVGKTSREDVLRLFGAPTDIRSTLGGETFRYLYVRQIAEGVNIGMSALWGLLSLSFFRAEEGREDTDNLTLFFDREGLLEAYSYSAAFPTDT